MHEALSAVPRDYLRFYMAMTLPESADSDFVPEDLVEKVNSELIDKYGNLVHRVVSLCRNNSIESLGGPQDGLDGRVKEEVQRGGLADYRDALEHIQVRRAVNSFLSLSKFINGYVNESQPWRLLKEDRERGGRMVLHTCLYALQALTAMLYPVVPDAARKVWGIINPDREISLDVSEATVFRPAGGEIPFRKIDLSSMNPNSLDLRVARVVDVRDHPSADRLYLLSLDLGGEARQIVAGLRNHYRPEQLRGRKIIVVRNLKKSKIRGGEVSEGMMLAADDGHGVHFLTVDSDVEPGTPVSLGDLNYNGSGSIDVEELSRFNLRAAERREEIRGCHRGRQGKEAHGRRCACCLRWRHRWRGKSQVMQALILSSTNSLLRLERK
ncbi:class I tRNA ligase family protein [Thermogymnomonas acidicola]|uniref:class I tRNA ligase family protein n=1 Tax=Thermogymnomonas acidicola TaxID=399579 RepID=UPI0009467DDC|nr:class I tRNA ligase family protein [Thermogymnomonas acidicola]